MFEESVQRKDAFFASHCYHNQCPWPETITMENDTYLTGEGWGLHLIECCHIQHPGRCTARAACEKPRPGAINGIQEPIVPYLKAPFDHEWAPATPGALI